MLTEGVFPETKEFLAGYWIVLVESTERAYDIAAKASAALGRTGNRSTCHSRCAASCRACREMRNGCAWPLVTFCSQRPRNLLHERSSNLRHVSCRANAS